MAINLLQPGNFIFLSSCLPAQAPLCLGEIEFNLNTLQCALAADLYPKFKLLFRPYSFICPITVALHYSGLGGLAKLAVGAA